LPRAAIGAILAVVGMKRADVGRRWEGAVQARIESSVTSLSWIPSEAVAGLTRVAFDVGLSHYDAPPPDVLEELEELRRSDRFRFANELWAWIEVEDGRIVAHGQEGRGWIGSSTLRLGSRSVAFEAVPFPDIRPAPRIGEASIRFEQTAGGRAGLPAPRRIRKRPFVRLVPPVAWSTLTLTLHADGRSEGRLAAASPFPRHWVYGHDRRLSTKTGLIDFETWYYEDVNAETPWGAENSPPVVAMAETALERELSRTIMRAGTAPRIIRLAAGHTLVKQGDPGGELYVLLDGIVTVEVDGEPLAELGPGAVLGERAVLEVGRRTATIRAVTPAKVATASAGQLDPDKLAELSAGHRREEHRSP
jgi:hypothetical protein